MTLAGERVEVPADARAQYELSFTEQWGDGVPLLPATDDAVLALLAATPYGADHVVCVLPPRNGVATVELVAVNAAMAGVEGAALLVDRRDFTTEHGRESATRFLSLPDPPTALVAGNTQIAHGVIEAVRDLGLRLRDDV